MTSQNLVAEPPNGDGTGELLSLQIAEYEALATRCTYFMAMQVGLWPLVLLLVPLLVQARGVVPDRALLWIALLGIDIVLFVYLHLVYEQHLMLLYIERELRMQVEATVKSTFWGYEPFLKRQRGARRDPSPHRLLAYSVAVLIAAAILLQWPIAWRDAAYVITNATLITFILRKTIALGRLRRQRSS